jgi:hypothetical protein
MAQEISKSSVDYRNSPVAWFCLMEKSREQGDFERAARAKRELERLGVHVTYRQRGGVRVSK